MNLSRQEWAARKREQSREQAVAKSIDSALAKLRAAAVSAERLTNDEHWDAFLRMCEARQQEDMLQLRAVQAELCDPEYMDPEKVIDLRHRMARIIGRVEARRDVMSLPKELIANGRSATAGK